MDLFVINRYADANEGINLIDQETKHLQKLKQKIEERKKAYNNKKPNVITLKESLNNPKEKEFNQNKDIIAQDDDLIKDNKANDSSSIQGGDQLNKTSFEFKVLGHSDFERKTQVKRILPYWLSHPINISTNLHNLSCSVKHLDWLHSTLKSTLFSEGVTHLFPVQEKIVPFILKQHMLPHTFWPHDICVSAPTGSGKTLAFVLPIIQILMDEIGQHVKALIVLPVQELATQVAKVFKRYSTKTGVKVALLCGSSPLRQEQQQIIHYTESSGWIVDADILVCTPGRLVEHIQNTKGFSLKYLKFLVIDEADRIMDHIQNDWLYHLDKHIKLQNMIMAGRVPNISWNNFTEQKQPPHKLLFSATLSQDPEKLEQWALFQPKLFSAAPANRVEDEDCIRKYRLPDELEEQFVTCQAENKPLVLYHFLAEQKWDKVLCFTNAAHTAHRLTVLLNIWGNDQFKVAELSSALDRSKRELVLKKFTKSEINVLISTDALARGIDIPACAYVISYDPPRNIKTYIHRVGRTGRAGRAGKAVTMLLPKQIHLFKELLQAEGKFELCSLEVQPDIFDRLSESYAWAIQETKKSIQTEISSKVKKSVALKRGYKNLKSLE